MQATAISERGNLTYRAIDEDFDLTAKRLITVVLRASTSELRFTPFFPSSPTQCPDDLTTLDFDFYLVEDEHINKDISWSASSTHSCSGLLPNAQVITEIPIHADPASDIGKWKPTQYHIQVRGRSAAGTTLYCGSISSSFYPGPSSAGEHVINLEPMAA
ncbi:MAG TPA: hypothetical protein EYO58_11700, partial [Flavobacteriales bacterium]|nr:hypothetical protein [Flavobacteriales bacterium]